MKRYILAVDQSTQGTKGLLFDEGGELIARADRPHRQIVSPEGWVSHDLKEILDNTRAVCRDVIEKAGIDAGAVAAFGISNQRETTAAWDRETGKPVCPAIVWQCARAEKIAARHRGQAEEIRRKTGLTLSPYFPAAKMQWILENVPQARKLADSGRLALGTIDSWLVWSLTEEHAFRTDYSNAARTQLFDIRNLCWDADLCSLFTVPLQCLPEASMSDSVFGMTDLGGVLPRAVPICGVLGDSNGALFGHDCRTPGDIKATYGTGSSVMMNIGDEVKISDRGLVTSIAWGIGGKVQYVFEGNLNYTGAVISWLKNDVRLIDHAAESGALAAAANPADRTYFVPAFSGLGAPYWDAEATGLFTGITRVTGRNEIVKACVESIGYQITDLVRLMREESGRSVSRLHVDGGPTGNAYLMQFQSDLAEAEVVVPKLQELSGMGAAYLAGISAGLYSDKTIFSTAGQTVYAPKMAKERSRRLYAGWQDAVARTLMHHSEEIEEETI